ncbi:MAG: 2-oxoacid:acceptor oxidoreductase subunit alpha [candidate division WOR-3 bacterium]
MPERIKRSILEPKRYFLSGNIACAEGALAAGCRFYAGYPITPSSEIMEHMAKRLPEVGGVFIQMEDEIGSISACIGASWAGAKAMTATSGPGFSLMLEGIGYALMTETPCVIVDVQRQGPATGQATRPGQGDIMQARWGAHGDYRIIALSPWSVQEMYDLTISAFNLSEKYRVPVILLSDEVVAHLKESILIPEEIKLFDRKKDKGLPPFGNDLVPPMPTFGEEANLLVTGSTHNEWGIRKVQDPDVSEKLVVRLCEKIEKNKKEIVRFETFFTDDCEICLISFGITARSAAYAVSLLRQEGIKAGLFRPITIWPFPEEDLKEITTSAKKILVCEMNRGQIIEEVKKILCNKEVFGLFKTRGEAIYPWEIIEKIK